MKTPRKRFLAILRLSIFAVIALFSTWLFLVLSSAWVYLDRLQNPPCVRSIQQTPAGFYPVTIQLKDGTPLSAWWHPAANGSVVVLMGGSGASRDAMLPEANLMAANGYGALTMDYRNCAGKAVTLGAEETDEAKAALAFVQTQNGVNWISMYGFSVGGVAAIRAAADDPTIAAVVAAGNYANLYEEIALTPPTKPLTLAWQIQQAVAGMYSVRTGVWAREISPIEDLAKIAPRPVLLIYGEDEIGAARGYTQFASAGQPKSLWVVEGVGHGGYLHAEPEQFRQQVVGFLNSSRTK